MGPEQPIGSSQGDQAAPRRILSYHLLPETPCPYLPGRWERKLLTQLAGPRAAADYGLLSRAGFRRSHFFAYRPACAGCSACVAVRVRAAEFAPGRSLRRVRRKNAGLKVELFPACATVEQFELFGAYVHSRHSDGEMAEMDFADYRKMIEDSPVDSRIAEFRDDTGRLTAACLLDLLPDGPSAVYSFFDPGQGDRSLGSYMVLWLIEQARAFGRPYVYLGYWVKSASKMDYKARFRPLEGLGPEGWALIPATD